MVYSLACSTAEKESVAEVVVISDTFKSCGVDSLVQAVNSADTSTAAAGMVKVLSVTGMASVVPSFSTVQDVK